MPGTLFTQGTLPGSTAELPGHVAVGCVLPSPAMGGWDVRAFLPRQQQKSAAGAGWTRLGGSQLFPAPQWLHGSKPSKLNVGLSKLLTPEMLNYSVKQTSRRLGLLRGQFYCVSGTPSVLLSWLSQ